MKIIVINVHGKDDFFRIIDEIPYILRKSKGKLKWTPTMICPNRMKTARELTEMEIFERLK